MSGPNAGWKPGDPIRAQVRDTMPIELAGMPARDVYRLFISAIVPRPIAFVSTQSPDGKGNLAPFSYFNAVCSDPPAVMFAVTRGPGGTKKDTLINVEATRELVVNLVSEEMAEPMNQCAANYPYGVDEMTQVGLTPVPSAHVRAARVGESPVQLECALHSLVELGSGGEGATTLVIARVLCMHVARDAYEGGKLTFERLRPLSRLGGITYMSPGKPFELPRGKA